MYLYIFLFFHQYSWRMSDLSDLNYNDTLRTNISCIFLWENKKKNICPYNLCHSSPVDEKINSIQVFYWHWSILHVYKNALLGIHYYEISNYENSLWYFDRFVS